MRIPLLSCPCAKLVRSYIELSTHLGQVNSRRPPLRDQPHGFGLELGAEFAPLTPS